MESKLKATQREVDTVKDIMLENFDKAEERKEKLEDLDQRATELLSDAFKKKAKEVKQKKQREYLKSKAGLIAIVTVLALVIITVVAFMLSSNSSDTSVTTAAVTTLPHPSEQP